MTDKEVSRYLELVERRLFILTHSGTDWRPEYGVALARIDQELVKLRKVVDAEHERRDQGVSKQFMNADPKRLREQLSILRFLLPKLPVLQKSFR